MPLHTVRLTISAILDHNNKISKFPNSRLGLSLDVRNPLFQRIGYVYQRDRGIICNARLMVTQAVRYLGQGLSQNLHGVSAWL